MNGSKQHQVIYVMGVSGSGKSTVGQRLGEELGIAFRDGDDFHPQANIEKMSSGQALVDEDRWGWLEAINVFVKKALEKNSLIIACSALKEVYREKLTNEIEEQCTWVYLHGSLELISKRMQSRGEHFFSATLLQSQFDTLEPPEYGEHIDVAMSVGEIVESITNKIGMPKSEFGLIGLGVMGKSLSRNLASRGFRLSLYNRYVKEVEENVATTFVTQFDELQGALGFQNLPAFIKSLESPRKIFLMIPAGSAIDQMIDTLILLLDAGDVVIDGGNAHYKESEKRGVKLKNEGIHFVGTGVSGGEEGALRGPSIMPGGSQEGYKIVQKYVEEIAAISPMKTKCCAYIGAGGAGHFVKMVHNGIEYAEMQLIAETYDVLRRGIGMSPDAIANIFEEWLDTDLRSYLLEITVGILRKKEEEAWLIDLILDKAGNKGTGSWTTIAASELGVPIPTITAALFARYQSTFKFQREKSDDIYSMPQNEKAISLEVIKGAYTVARIINHHQGFHLIATASKAYDWDIQFADLAQIWTNGCIIRSKLMEDLIEVLGHGTLILDHPDMVKKVKANYESLVKFAVETFTLGVAIPCHSASLQYLQTYTKAQSSANIIQAQRDYFGAHTYERVDDTSGKKYHTIWNS